MQYYRFSNAFFQLVCKTLSFVHVDADSFSEYKFHGGWMTESYHDLNDQIDSLIVRGDAVEMYRVVYG